VIANIREFSAPAGLDLKPSETGVEATAAAARRLGGFYNQGAEALNTVAALKNQTGSEVAGAVKDIGQVAVDYEDHRQISAGAASGSKVMMGLTNQWNQIISDPSIDPNDPAIQKKFLEETVEPNLNQFKDGFTTEKSQAWAEQFVDKYRQHMFEKTTADISTLAKIATSKNVNDAITFKSNMAMQDPSSVPFLIKSMKDTVGAVVDTSPTLNPIDKARAHAELESQGIAQIVKSGAIGAIQKSGNPEATAAEWIKKYPDYIDGGEAKQLAGNARQQIRANNYDYEVNRRRQKEVAQDKSTEATNQYLIDVRSQDPKLANDPTAKKILNDPTLLKADKNNLLNYIDRQLKPETQSQLSQQSFVGLLRDLRAPDADPDKVMQKAWDARLADPGKPGSLSEKDFNQFRAEVVARKTPEGAALEHDRAQFFHNYGTAIAGALYTPAIGDPKVYNAEMDARRVENDLKRKGLDPHLAYDPASPYFLGKPERIAKWSSSMQQDLTTMSSTPAKPVAAPPKPVPQVGEVRDGYEYLGGSPGAASSWRKVQ
jgi:hypothetical protein